MTEWTNWASIKRPRCLSFWIEKQHDPSLLDFLIHVRDYSSSNPTPWKPSYIPFIFKESDNIGIFYISQLPEEKKVKRMSAEYSTGNGVFTYRHRYVSVSWRYLIEDVINIAGNYLVNEHAHEPNLAFVLSNGVFHKFRDTGVCYQMWPTKFEVISYTPGYVIHGDGVPHYNFVRTEYRMYWTAKKWEITGAPNEAVPAFDHIPSTTELVDLFINGLAEAGISPLGGSRTFRIGNPEEKNLVAKDYMEDYVGSLRPVGESSTHG